MKCEEYSMQTYGANHCQWVFKQGRYALVSVLGFDTQRNVWWIVSNNKTRGNGNAQALLKECQRLGYQDCHIAHQGKKHSIWR